MTFSKPFLVFATISLLPAFACASPTDADESAAESQSDELAAVDPGDDTAFRDALRELYANVDAEADVHTSALAPRGAGDLLNLAEKKLCAYLKPLAKTPAFSHPFFFVGGTLHGAGVVGGQAGIDAVWDLYDQQAASFVHSDRLLETGVSLGATMSVGLAFGAKKNVFDAWSGEFEAVGAEAGIPVFRWFSGGLSYFQSPDRTIRGMNTTTTISRSLFALPVTVSASRGMWVPYDAGTERMKWSVLGFPKVTVEHGQVGGKTYAYLQYHARFGSSLKQSGIGLGTGLLKKTGKDPKAIAAAELAVAIGLWRDARKAIDKMCK